MLLWASVRHLLNGLTLTNQIQAQSHSRRNSMVATSLSHASDGISPIHMIKGASTEFNANALVASALTTMAGKLVDTFPPSPEASEAERLKLENAREAMFHQLSKEVYTSLMDSVMPPSLFASCPFPMQQMLSETCKWFMLGLVARDFDADLFHDKTVQFLANLLTEFRKRVIAAFPSARAYEEAWSRHRSGSDARSAQQQKQEQDARMRDKLALMMDKLNRACAICGSKEHVKGCAACGAVFYCSKEHQVQHWKSGHKKECVATEKKL